MDSMVCGKSAQFQFIALTLPGLPEPSIAIAAACAGGLGVLDLEYTGDICVARESIRRMVGMPRGQYGIKVNGSDDAFVASLISDIPDGVEVVIIAGGDPENIRKYVDTLHNTRRKVILEVTSLDQAIRGERLGADGLIAKGNEDAGIVGEKTSFILLQQILSQANVPVFAQGGIGLHTAAACYAAGAAGIVLGTQLILSRESPLPEDVKASIGKMDGSETKLFGVNTDTPCRVYIRPGFPCLEDLRNGEKFAESNGCQSDKRQNEWRNIIRKHLSWDNTKNPLWLLGMDVASAVTLARKYSTVGSIIQGIRRSVSSHIKITKTTAILQKDSPLAKSHGTRYPIVQGPMSRITDSPAFSAQVFDGGALPFVALGMLRGGDVETILRGVKALQGTRPWGVGVLGFNEESLFKEQVEALSSFSPPFAIIAGGLSHQVSLLESRGIITYVHVPSPDILEMLLQSGAKRFIFEGSECGGHIGPRPSFVLWEVMTEKLLDSLKTSDTVDQYHVLYGGGIHDALSSSMVAAIAAPLARLGVRIGVIMGTAYLFTSEIVESKAIVAGYQKNVIDCLQTVVLESSPGHAIRCCNTPFTRKFEAKKRELLEQKATAKEMSEILGQMILGKSRIAAKGLLKNRDEEQQRPGDSLVPIDSAIQHEEGLYMVGQLATLHERTFTVSELHEEVAIRASAKLAALLPYETGTVMQKPQSSNIAIIGMACVLPKSGDISTYWENILSKTNAITEIPANRWDWRLYYDKDRHAKDKIYSKWGGFIDDMVFDPTLYGMPPKSIESIDPMQLMALEVARRTIADAGYEDREFDREMTSVIIGASGGTGDVGMQYGVRTELPRFQGVLPVPVAERLPEWTEDTFAGILLNVISGRIANRLNFGGINFTIDAACASSLAAIYQGVSELVSGRSNLVIAGGVDTVQGPFGYMCFSKTQALSPRGRCCTFDATADGIVISEGIAMVALKRLEDAERDGDRIYGVIKGVGASSDGKAKGLTAPLPKGQLLAMHRAYEQAGFCPDTVGLFEAHGTGTVVGDTAELASTTSLLKEAGSTAYQAAIGSVKTLIGHTKATAGVAGLIKATLALYHHVLPPHYGVTQPNQVLLESDSPLYLVDQAAPWITVKNRPRRAAVSAFGFGGTNFHVALEEYASGPSSLLRQAPSQRWPSELLLWHGASREDLKLKLTQVLQNLESVTKVGLCGLGYDLAKAYQAGGETLAIVATDVSDLTNKIRSALSYLGGEAANIQPGVYHGKIPVPADKVAVLFPGQGSQYTGMLRELALNFPVYAETLSAADQFLGEQFANRFGRGIQLSNFIFPRGSYHERAKADASIALTSTDVAQPALGAVGAGLWKLMRSFGLSPQMLGGHSYGEFVAFFAGNVIDFDTLMLLSEARGRFIVDSVKNARNELGTMAAVQASRLYVEKMISNIDGVVVANHNSPQQCVISGSALAIQEASEKMSQDGIVVSKISVAAAFHSRFVAPAQSALADLIKQTVWRSATIPVYSNTTGEPHAQDVKKVKQVAINHLVQPVEFLAQIEAMYRDGARVFLELGPKTVLTKLINSILKDRPHCAVPIDGNGGGITGMLHAFGQLLCAGVALDVVQLFKGRGSFGDGRTPLPRMQSPVQDNKHLWLLNGSGVRRANVPVQQIGVRMEDVISSPTGLPGNDAQFFSKTDDTVVGVRKLASKKHREENVQMRDHRQVPTSGDSAVMAEYFALMRQFLETQERMMSMYMGEVNVGRRPGLRARSMRPQSFYGNAVPVPNPSALKTPVPVEPELPSGVPTDTDIQDRPFAVPDSKRISDKDISLQEKASAETRPGNGPFERVERGKITHILLGIIEEKTGYPPDMVGLSQNLEADLGIDSIKRVEIVNALLKALPTGYRELLGKDLGGLNTKHTINGMLDALDKIKPEGSLSVPCDKVEMEMTPCSTSQPFRHIVVPKLESIKGMA